MKSFLKKIGLYDAIKFCHNRYKYFLQKILKLIFNSNIVLIYHRVADVGSDPHKLCVSPKNFKEQIKYLKENFNIVPLYEVIQDLADGQIKSGSVAITFDDGYADTLHAALPILEKFGVPATIFVTVGSIGLPESFYWEKGTEIKDRGRCLTKEELIKLAEHPLIDIGAHTMTHPNMAKLDKKKQEEEIMLSKKRLEEIVNKNISLFAYPFGSKDSFTSETTRLVKNADFISAVSSKKEKVFNFSKLFAVPRINIRNCDLEEFKKIIETA
ncbi:MAG: hypothetical protein A3E02_00795 [Candidatus Zambryskibacteria bacterium RIFCSPHIGHO2_12_FULL_38_34]|uniref:NodB homology domain-containing protein n=1 Tax=Candidatus Zambryskibacteria bacterium RIFCSPLOWO2_12_FULL_39_16 TaxID=1802775 RepID=A0A1G2UQY3_9BACT|nr:MAG: hypothetical protein A3D37_01360 [Candidatus Zambryskibacteria bacterium RIFCSPHIGHO2_02_FULL_38_22]OHA97334.1 MAG: hypothetical protein A3E02_00795 [Candidatus Zambryskibacteria bacterium RIFCSPHIGHO2_12_FULL_38_34]OHB08222.1 MAG: hypothetical protein A3I19_01850 [Candidatus Zambryskibacteria bacterium RIFCSPLOWO2_02_FULL_38_13]OHB11764.1 MAG: hypothetical protein A3G46_01470 [Candidatus Zambryskibacteria bacterium RIFCSPLOWO2_12_FULL_39_16]